MSETLPHETGTSPATGHPVVDEVLASLERLGAGPAGYHVAVFEFAHERLRGALADAASGALTGTRTGPADV